MNPLEWASDSSPRTGILLKSGLVALCLEIVLVTSIGWHKHWLAHPPQALTVEDRFIEAQVFQMPQEAHLVEEKKIRAAPVQPEKVLNKSPGRSRMATHPSQTLEEQNKTSSGPKAAITHGPVVVYSPPPVIPPYLQDQELQAHVLIDFFINTQGTATFNLVGSSGNEELDAIALESVKKWIFRPAENEGKAVDAKVRLKIVFVVQ